MQKNSMSFGIIFKESEKISSEILPNGKNILFFCYKIYLII